ncbi:hypothetical protein MPC4_10330 [Methylocella tundrae]|uniref:Uncharacterized protein n=1 Tax=Methylocella tundrae TaxID=227605 RepID=A0A8B6M2B5_METTU|nr:hypothetical protein MPC4_10330 [Methylocella tundrae]
MGFGNDCPGAVLLPLLGGLDRLGLLSDLVAESGAFGALPDPRLFQRSGSFSSARG